MNKLLIPVITAFLIIACSQGNNQQPPTRDLKQVENDWMQAMMKRDKPVLEQLVAPEFEVTSIKYIDSPAVSRNMWMYNTMNDLKIDSVHFIKTKVTTIDEVGIVKAYFYWSGRYDGSPFFDSTSFVDTWIRRNSGWQVVSRVITDSE